MLDIRSRIERLLAWLRLARVALEVPEADRLYGELSKLGELAARPLDDAQRELPTAQAHTLLTLKAWKALLK